MPSPLALLGAPQGSLVLDAPSPNGSPDGEEPDGGAGVPHASSVLTGAEAEWVEKRAQTGKTKSWSNVFAISVTYSYCPKLSTKLQTVLSE